MPRGLVLALAALLSSSAVLCGLVAVSEAMRPNPRGFWFWVAGVAIFAVLAAIQL